MSDHESEFDPYHKWLGIVPKDRPPHHYRLLGVEIFEEDLDVIDIHANKQASYLRTCAKGTHSAIAEKLLNEVAAARLCLLDPEKKAEYDARLRASQAAAASETNPPRALAMPAATNPPAAAPAAGAFLPPSTPPAPVPSALPAPVPVANVRPAPVVRAVSPASPVGGVNDAQPLTTVKRHSRRASTYARSRRRKTNVWVYALCIGALLIVGALLILLFTIGQ